MKHYQFQSTLVCPPSAVHVHDHDRHRHFLEPEHLTATPLTINLDPAYAGIASNYDLCRAPVFSLWAKTAGSALFRVSRCLYRYLALLGIPDIWYNRRAQNLLWITNTNVSCMLQTELSIAGSIWGIESVKSLIKEWKMMSGYSGLLLG